MDFWPYHTLEISHTSYIQLLLILLDLSIAFLTLPIGRGSRFVINASNLLCLFLLPHIGVSTLFKVVRP